jgi:hypothetical protein
MFLSNGLRPNNADPSDLRHYPSLAAVLALLEFCRVQFSGYRDLVAMLLRLGPRNAGDGEEPEGSAVRPRIHTCATCTLVLSMFKDSYKHMSSVQTRS